MEKEINPQANGARESSPLNAQKEIIAPTPQADDEGCKYLIVKRDLYYRPNAAGYTGIKDDAGRYTLDQVALHFPNLDSPNQDGMCFLHEDDAPDYSPACYRDLKLEHQAKKAAAERDALKAKLAEVERERDEARTERNMAEGNIDDLHNEIDTLKAQLATARDEGFNDGADKTALEAEDYIDCPYAKEGFRKTSSALKKGGA